jgi:hypothetical protein
MTVKKSLAILLGAGVLFGLGACGGSGGSTTSSSSSINNSSGSSSSVAVTPLSLTGKVIDGYIGGAKVCLDLNSNLLCDSGEPSTTTKSDGSYSLSYSGSIDGVQVLAVVPVGATDSDLGIISSTYSLLTPAESVASGRGAITPLTTLVSIEARESGKTIAEAEQSVIANNNLPVTSLIGYDFKAVNNDTNDKMAKVAQVTAAAIAEVSKQIKSNTTDLSEGEVAKAAISQVKSAVLPQILTTSGEALLTVVNGDDQEDIAAKVRSCIGTTITGNIQNIVAQTNSGDPLFLDMRQALGGGIVGARLSSGDYIDDNGQRVNGSWGGYTNALRGHYLHVDPVTGKTDDIDKVLVNSKWYTRYDDSLEHAIFIEGSNEWVTEPEQNGLPSNVSFSGNCLLIPAYIGATEGRKICGVKKDFSGKLMSEVIKNFCKDGNLIPITNCDLQAKFPNDSYAADLTFTTTKDIYEISNSISWSGYAASMEDFLVNYTASFGSTGDSCNTLFKIKNYDPSSSAGVMEWRKNRNYSCGTNGFSPDSAEEDTAFSLINLGGKKIVKVLAPNIFRQLNPGDQKSYIIFGEMRTAGGGTGVYDGNFDKKDLSWNMLFTGNLNADSQFLSKTLFNSLLAASKLPAYPYPQ